MPRPATVLTAAEIATLEACCAGGPHPRQRRRAQAILAHSRGLQLPQLARVFAVDYTTAHAWLQAWERRGIAGLAEGARAGRPPLLDAAAKKKVATALGDARQQLRTLLVELATDGLPAVSLATLRRLVKELGYSWKRMRRSLRSQRDPVLFDFFRQELDVLRQAEKAGELDLVFADECRFSRQAPVPYAWQRRGQPPVELPAQRGGWTVLGLWHAHAPQQPLWSWYLPGALTGALFVAAVDEWSQTLTNPTVLVLDNASIHHALLVRLALPRWRKRGLRLQFLPAYSPELNRIEILWHHCKHLWLTPADYQTEEVLLEAVKRVLKGVGDEYRVTFA